MNPSLKDVIFLRRDTRLCGSDQFGNQIPYCILKRFFVPKSPQCATKGILVHLLSYTLPDAVRKLLQTGNVGSIQSRFRNKMLGQFAYQFG